MSNSIPNIGPFAGDFWDGFSLGLTLVLMLATCFLGYRLKKLFITVFGALIGLALGVAIGLVWLQNVSLTVILCLTLAAIISLISFKMYRTGVFIWVVFSVFLTVYDLLMPFFDTAVQIQNILLPVISLISALLAGILTLRFMRPVIIVTTAFNGGFSGAMSLVGVGASLWHYSLTDQITLTVTLSLGALLTVLGMLVQFKDKKHRR